MLYTLNMEYIEIDLSEGTFNRLPSGEKTGLSLALDLYDRYPEDDVIIFAAPSSKALDNAGSSVFSILYNSPITGEKAFAYSNFPFGYSMYKLDMSALVIKGCVHRLSYISLYSGNFDIISCEHLKGVSSAEFEKEARSITDSVLSTGRAADNGVKYATLQFQGKAINGAGLGYLFHLKGLKGIIAPGYSVTEGASVSKDAFRRVRKIEKSQFARRVRKQGACCFVEDALRLGWIPVRGYSDRFDPRAYSLSAASFAELYGNYPDSCSDCFLACGRRKKDSSALPGWVDVMMLGSNLGIFSPEKVIRLTETALKEGLDSAHLGALLSYALSLDEKERDIIGLRDLNVDNLQKLIVLIGENRGAGAVFESGLGAFPDAIKSAKGEAIFADLRGAYSQAIAASMSLNLFLPSGLVLPKYPVSAECAAILAFYEIIYILALLEYGYRPFSAVALYWSNLPELAFHVPQLMRFYCRRFSIYGHKMKDLLPKGLEIFERLGLGFDDIPEHFRMDPESASDNRTVPMLKLQEFFLSEKLKAEIISKSIREKSSKPSSESKAADAPSDERGLDADPGLTR